MRLHILAGCRDLLRPEKLPAEMLAELIGPRIRPATAFWLSQRTGRFYHDFLLDPAEDRRIEVFALSLRDNFGRRFEPLVALPDLMREASGPAAPDDAGRRPLEVVRAIWRLRPAETLVLHALALPASIDGGDGWAGTAELTGPFLRGRLDGLRAAFAAEGVEPAAVEAVVTEVRPGAPAFAPLLRNAVARQIAARAGRSLEGAGLAAEPWLLREAAARVLEGWGRAGIVPSRPLGVQDLDRLAERMMATLLARAPADA